MVVDHQKEEEYNPSAVEAFMPITDDGIHRSLKNCEAFLEKGGGVKDIK
jgi:hypothetical protein